MKRIRSVTALLLAVLMLVTTVPLYAAAAWLGDVTTDDNVNMRDCLRLYQAIKFGEIPEGDFAILGDFDENDAVNMRDCMLLYQSIKSGAGTKEISLSSEQPQEDPNALTPIDPDDYYGRSLLAAESATYAAVYDYLDEQFNAMNTDIPLYSFGITLETFERIMQYYRDDHPEVFWVNRAYSYYYYVQNNEQRVYSVQQEYLYSVGEVSTGKVQLENAAAAYLEGITNAMPKEERARLIHDRIILGADYDTTLSAPHTRDPMGVLVLGTGVCESYSRAYQYLLYRCGIRSSLVTGLTHGGEYHMWNVVEFDGQWYQTDVTWDDPVFSSPIPEYLTYTYYNITTEEMLLDRDIELVYSNFDDTYQISPVIPECTATAENYYVKYAVALSSFDVDIVAKEIVRSIEEGTPAAFAVTGSYTLDELQSDFETQFWTVIDKANALLASDQQLTTPGYVLKSRCGYGAMELYLRNM